MKTVATFAAAALMAATPALATEGFDAPVTAETLVDRAELTRLVDTLDAAVDAKDWTRARALFTDEVAVDFTSLVGGEPATIPAEGLIGGWSGNLTAEKTSFHLRGNHQIAFTGPDSAVMESHGYAWNRMDRGGLEENGGNPLWEVWGTYEHSFVRGEGGWRIDGMRFTVTAERGNSFVRDTPGS